MAMIIGVFTSREKMLGMLLSSDTFYRENKLKYYLFKGCLMSAVHYREFVP